MLEGMGNRPSGDPNVRAKDIFAMIDVNQDGTLTKDEFIKGKDTLYLYHFWLVMVIFPSQAAKLMTS